MAHKLDVTKLNLSVQNIHRIAKEFGYKEKVVKCSGGMAFLYIEHPYYRTPYPNILSSDVRTYNYVKRVFERE